MDPDLVGEAGPTEAAAMDVGFVRATTTPQRASWNGLTGAADGALAVVPPTSPCSWMT